jgi:hypothetical protein
MAVEFEHEGSGLIQVLGTNLSEFSEVKQIVKLFTRVLTQVRSQDTCTDSDRSLHSRFD